jgi:hypothetical protein
MKVKGPTSPLSGAPEPLDPRDLRRMAEGDGFASALSELAGQTGASGAGQSSSASNPTRAALEQIASSADLATAEGAASAVRESARFMVRSRLGKSYRDTEQGEQLAAELGQYVASDPLLKGKLLSILRKLKAD